MFLEEQSSTRSLTSWIGTSALLPDTGPAARALAPRVRWRIVSPAGCSGQRASSGRSRWTWGASLDFAGRLQDYAPLLRVNPRPIGQSPLDMGSIDHLQDRAPRNGA